MSHRNYGIRPRHEACYQPLAARPSIWRVMLHVGLGITALSMLIAALFTMAYIIHEMLVLL